MSITTLEVGALGCCCYIVGPDDVREGEARCVVIDPGAEAQRIAAEVRRLGYAVDAVFLTHAHVDHIGGVRGILAEWPEAVLMCSEETSRRASDAKLNLSSLMGQSISTPPAGRILKDGETFTAAGLEWKAVEVPGHEPGEMAYILGDGSVTFTGDAVFAGSIGRSDFPGGDGPLLVRGVRNLLESLPENGVLFPGHGPSTEVLEELRHNPFLNGYL